MISTLYDSFVSFPNKSFAHIYEEIVKCFSYFCLVIDCLKKIQLRFCKLLLKLKSSTPNYMIYGELERFPIEIDIKIRMVSFWARLLLGKETKLSYLSYKLLYTLSIEDNVHFVWIKYLKELFYETGVNIIPPTSFYR
jgi:hypothetical protein